MHVPDAATSGAEVILQVGEALPNGAHGVERGGGERCPTEVGVKHHAGGVDYWAQRGKLTGGESGRDRMHPTGVVGRRGSLEPRRLDDVPGDVRDERARRELAEPAHALELEQRADGRQ